MSAKQVVKYNCDNCEKEETIDVYEYENFDYDFDYNEVDTNDLPENWFGIRGLFQSKIQPPKEYEIKETDETVKEKTYKTKPYIQKHSIENLEHKTFCSKDCLIDALERNL